MAKRSVSRHRPLDLFSRRLLKARVAALGDHTLHVTDDGELLVVENRQNKLVYTHTERDALVDEWLEPLERELAAGNRPDLGGAKKPRRVQVWRARASLQQAAKQVLKLYRAPGWDRLAGETDGGYTELGELEEALGKLETALCATDPLPPREQHDDGADRLSDETVRAIASIVDDEERSAIYAIDALVEVLAARLHEHGSLGVGSDRGGHDHALFQLLERECARATAGAKAVRA